MEGVSTSTEVVPYGADLEFLDKIGSGSFGVVYKARRSSRHLCAVKFLQCQLQSQVPADSKTYARFNQECQIMNQIRHDNIVQCFGTANLVLIMELMDCNLGEFVAKSSLRFCSCVDIVGHIAQAISYLHQNNVIHRDLSSANVLMKGNIAKVSDFGMARLLSTFSSYDLTKSPGAAAYMPPEAQLDPPRYDHKLDMFSCGVLIIQILTGKFPKPVNFVEDPHQRPCNNERERRANHINKCNDDNPLKKIALACIENNKELRPSADQLCVLIEDLQRSQLYCEDKAIAEQGMQLVAQHDIPKIAQIYQYQSQTISSLQSEVVDLKESKKTNESQIQQLQSTVLQLQQRGELRDQALQAEMDSLKSDFLTLQDFKLNVQQQVDAYIQEALTENNKEKQQLREILDVSNQEKMQLQQEKEQITEHAIQLQQEKDQITQHAIELKSKCVELENSFSSLSLSVSSQSHDNSALNEMTFVPSKPAIQPMHRWSSAVFHENTLYIMPARTTKILKFSEDSWTSLQSDCKSEYSTLALVNKELVTIGGRDGKVSSSKLYTLRDGKWIEDLPEMNPGRDSIIAITSGKALIIAGGRGQIQTPSGIRGSSRKAVFGSLKAVEILSTENNRIWQSACELPFPLHHASITIHGDRIFILGGFQTSQSKTNLALNSVLTCKLSDLFLSLTVPTQVWSEVCELQVSRSTCITYDSRLLAIGGAEPEDKASNVASKKPSNVVYCYNEEADCWKVLSNLTIPRVQCFAAVLSNRLFVIGGTAGGGTPNSSVEVAM